MKTMLRTALILVVITLYGMGLKAQVKVDDTNLISQLSSLNALSITDAAKYFTDHNYTMFSKQTIPQATYSLELYKYKIKDKSSSYLLSVIADKVNASGYITYSEEEYQQILKIVKDLGFKPGEAATAESGKTLFAKDDIRFIVQKKTAANGSVFYVLMLSDLVKTAQLIGLKK